MTRKGNRNKGKKPIDPTSKTFPNYLVSNEEQEDSRKKEEGRLIHHSPFIAEDRLDTSSGIPFLQQNQESFTQRREQETTPRKDYFTEGKRRIHVEKREKQSYAFYRSRRAFKVTEVPSLWNTDFKGKRSAGTYQKIKQELFVPTEELILLDVDSTPSNQLVNDLFGKEKESGKKGV